MGWGNLGGGTRINKWQQRPAYAGGQRGGGWGVGRAWGGAVQHQPGSTQRGNGTGWGGGVGVGNAQSAGQTIVQPQRHHR